MYIRHTITFFVRSKIQELTLKFYSLTRKQNACVSDMHLA